MMAEKEGEQARVRSDQKKLRAEAEIHDIGRRNRGCRNDNKLEHLKQQYIDGDLTEAEFEQRLEKLDLLDESTHDTAGPPQRKHDNSEGLHFLLWGFFVGAAIVLVTGSFAALYLGSIFLATVLFLLGIITFLMPFDLRDEMAVSHL